jgi:hypothetical protein
MPRPSVGEVWLVDLGLAAKVRPCLILSDYPADDELALVVVVPHTTAVRGNRWELTAQHQVETFDCGNEPLNQYLKRGALANPASGIARTYVTTPAGKEAYKLSSPLAPRFREPRRWPSFPRQWTKKSAHPLWPTRCLGTDPVVKGDGTNCEAPLHTIGVATVMNTHQASTAG